MSTKNNKDETPFRYAHAEIRNQVVVICGPTRCQLDNGGALDFDRIKHYKYVLPVTVITKKKT